MGGIVTLQLGDEKQNQTKKQKTQHPEHLQETKRRSEHSNRPVAKKESRDTIQSVRCNSDVQ